ncbi:MAG TPA: nuclear transport factor 2 family protein [Burkholderiales bacterium]|nr:nuclear transport factor 2 family protein [Burkholderiales bacterium]
MKNQVGTKAVRLAAVVLRRAWCGGPLTNLALGALVLALLPGLAQAMIYSCADETGRVILRDVPCKRNETNRETGRVVRASRSLQSPGRPPRTGDKITEAQVQALADGLDAAMGRQDVNGMLGYLAADAVVELEYRLPQGLQFKRFNKAEYAAYLRDGVQSGSDYQRENGQVQLAPGALYAELAGTMRETIRMQGERLSGSTRFKSMVELRDGRAQITLLRAVTTFDVPDKKEQEEKRKRVAK